MSRTNNVGAMVTALEITMAELDAGKITPDAAVLRIVQEAKKMEQISKVTQSPGHLMAYAFAKSVLAQIADSASEKFNLH